MTARSFVWLSIGGGAWSLGANWSDVTDGISPSLYAPGAEDSVIIAGPNGASMQTITGGTAPGQVMVAAALFTGNTLLTGQFSIAALTLGQILPGGSPQGGLLELAGSTALTAGTANIFAGSLLASAGATLSLNGALTLGDAPSASTASLSVTNGGRVASASLFLASANDSIYVDPSAILEVGAGAGTGTSPGPGRSTAATGQLTIDPGAILAGQGEANAYGAITNNGTISASGGTLSGGILSGSTLSLGSLTGTGTLAIQQGATLFLNGACGAGQSVAFAGANATLALAAEFDAPAGHVSGFAAGDSIDVRGSQISAATYSAGVLTLFYGAVVADTIQLAGDYSNSVFLTAGDGAGGTLITVAPSSSGGGGPSAGTATPDQYQWLATTSSGWNQANNWADSTRSQNPAAIAPGANDQVAIAAAGGSFTVIAGPANAATLDLTGEVALAGIYAIGTLTVGDASAPSAGTLDLLAGTELGTRTANVADGAISVAGSASALRVAGVITLGGGPAGVGLPVATLSATAGGVVRAGSLVMGGGSGATLTTDPTGIVEVGTAGHAAAGMVTIDAGATLSGNGAVNPLGQITDNGTITANAGTLSLGTISGTGSLVVAAGATLELLGATACPIAMQGDQATGGSVLAFANVRVAPSGIISGLQTGDLIHLEGSPLTAAVWNGSLGTLALLYGNTVVTRLNLTGILANPRFAVAPDGAGGTYILVTNATGGGGDPGQSGTDTLAWVNPASGGWAKSINWTDVTLGKPATQPPGAATPVQIGGPGGTAFQNVSGYGTCASLSLSGNTLFAGAFATGPLTLASGASAVLGAGTVLMASQASIADAALTASGTGAELTVAGTLSLTGTASLLAAEGGGGVLCGSLWLAGAGNVVNADASSWVDVGIAGATELGAVTVEAGFTLRGAGNINLAGAIQDDGAIVAQGGTLRLGTTDGAGGLAIGTGATLALEAEESCPIRFVGAASSLELDATRITAGTIIGFAAGDAIVIGSAPVDAVSYQPQAGGIGILSLSASGTLIATLSLLGNYTNLVFGVQPDGAGAQITLSPQGAPSPPAGTVSPDNYLWVGTPGPSWANPNAWIDQTAGQNPARVAPGLNDLVSIQGGNASAVTLIGPGNAASLSLSGTVALSGAFATGTLTVDGVLALAAGTTLRAGAAQAAGGITLNGGVLGVDGKLTLGTCGPDGAPAAGTAGKSGVLDVTGGGAAELSGLLLAGPASAVTVDATGRVEIGGTGGAAAGTVAVDAGGLLSGAGSVAVGGLLVDQGTISASGGTLLLGSVLGSGTLAIGPGATLALLGTGSPGLTADFAGGGTLSLSAAALATAPLLTGFGTGCAILLPVLSATALAATSASYALIAPGVGVISIDAGSQLLAQLTILGSQAGLTFGVTGLPGGETILTATQSQNGGTGGSFMTNPIKSGGTNLTLNALILSLEGTLGYASSELASFALLNTEVREWFSVDGLPPPANTSGLPGLEVIGPLSSQTGGGIGPGGAIQLTHGYRAILLEGQENLALTDGGLGHALLVGNYGRDSIAALGEGDTVVGAPGASTTLYAGLPASIAGSATGYDVTFIGGGNDTIATNNDAAHITTSTGHSQIFLGMPQTAGVSNSVILNGTDTVICGGTGGNGGVRDYVTVNAAAGLVGDLIFGSAQSELFFVGGNTPSTIVGNGGVLALQGGAANGTVIWGGTSQEVTYAGHGGSAVIVAGSGQTLVQGGTGPVTVFGGTGPGIFSGQAGSVFVIGTGPSTVQAAAGVGVYIAGGANVSVAGGAGADVYGGTSTGNILFDATGGNETLWGGHGNDTFVTGAGHDGLVGGGGNNVFEYRNGFAGGSDTIFGFAPGQDVITLRGYGTNIPAITYAFGDSILHLTDGTQIIVYNVPNLTAASIQTF